MKTKAELKALKKQYETLNSKLNELTEVELEKISSGVSNNKKVYYFGDVYRSNANVFYVVTDEINTLGEVHCDYYGYEPQDEIGLGSFIGKANVSRAFFNNYTYVSHIDGYQTR